jgi:hypothetical protein
MADWVIVAAAGKKDEHDWQDQDETDSEWKPALM